MFLGFLQHLSFHESEKSARLGQLVLNLAEFAGKGKVTRRYLLDEGKTNATIKVRALSLLFREGEDRAEFGLGRFIGWNS